MREEHLQIRTLLRQGPCINYLHKRNFTLTDRLAPVRKRANGGGVRRDGGGRYTRATAGEDENSLEGSEVVLARGLKSVRVTGKRLSCDSLP